MIEDQILSMEDTAIIFYNEEEIRDFVANYLWCIETITGHEHTKLGINLCTLMQRYGRVAIRISGKKYINTSIGSIGLGDGEIYKHGALGVKTIIEYRSLVSSRELEQSIIPDVSTLF